MYPSEACELIGEIERHRGASVAAVRTLAIEYARRVRAKADSSTMFLMLGLISGAECLGAYTWRKSKGAPLSWRLFGRFRDLGMVMFVLQRYRSGVNQHNEVWNDFYLSRWIITGERGDALALYSRARLDLPQPCPEVFRLSKLKAVFRIRELRRRNGEFDGLIKTFEAVSGPVDAELAKCNG